MLATLDTLAELLELENEMEEAEMSLFLTTVVGLIKNSTLMRVRVAAYAALEASGKQVAGNIARRNERDYLMQVPVYFANLIPAQRPQLAIAAISDHLHHNHTSGTFYQQPFVSPSTVKGEPECGRVEWSFTLCIYAQPWLTSLSHLTSPPLYQYQELVFPAAVRGEPKRGGRGEWGCSFLPCKLPLCTSSTTSPTSSYH